MTWRRWLVLSLLAAALAATQRFGLDSRPEKKLEDRYTKIAEMPAGDMVPTYIASLFFGAFRAIVIDVLWIQLRRVEDERRWYERREILKLISYFQPRNPEVWSHLGWHSAYNVANGFTDPEKSWEWVKFGLTWLRQGNRQLPHSAHLKYEVGYTLLHKPSWRDGRLDVALLDRIEKDAELQEMLFDAKPPRPMSAFELAIVWFERARADLETGALGRAKTQMGLYMYQSTMDGFILDCLYKQGVYLWRHKGKTEEAKTWFRRAEEHARRMMATVYRPEGRPSPYFGDRAEFYAKMPEIVDLYEKARGGRREDELAFVAFVQKVLAERERIDQQFLWYRFDPASPLHAIKQKLVGARDAQECNDSFDMAAYVQPEQTVAAALEPEGLDTDYYVFERHAPVFHGPPEERPPPPPLTVRIAFTRPATATMDLKATVLDGNRVPLASAEARGAAELRFESRTYGGYYLKVEPLSPASPWPSDTRYEFRIRLGE